MKKTLYTVLTALAFTGCSKETIKTNSVAAPNGQAQAVSFNVSDFGMTTGGIRTNSISKVNALKDQIRYLQYGVLIWQAPDDINPITTLYRSQDHTASEANFGLIKDSLQDGRYHVGFIGADVKGKFDVETIFQHGGPDLPRLTYYLDYRLLTTNIFAAYIDTTVVGAPINKPVVLKRAISQVTVHLNDAIPVGAAKFVLRFSDYPLSLDVASGYGFVRGREEEYNPDATFEFPINSNAIGKSGMEITSIVWPHYYPSIVVDCLDAQGKVIAHRVLPKNLANFYNKLDPNIQYKFSGSLFGQTANFNVSVDTTWKTPVNTTFSIPGKTQHIF
ncbi:MAG: hypothetical protein JKY70_18925 [Mucilaginibacter sp.]|nr:hypothetical protein [Mucilaginibacter sp.]